MKLLATTLLSLSFALTTLTASAEMVQVSPHMGEMTGQVGTDDDMKDRLRFEPFQLLEEMFFRDDVVFLMRHGPTNWSKLDAKDVAPTDCGNQRILSDDGARSMQALGTLMATNEILPSRIVVSEWCRNQQTVENLLSGVARVDAEAAQDMPVETDPALNLLLALQGAPSVKDMRRRISAWDGDPDRKGPLLVISHFTNIEEMTDFSVYEGEMLILDPKRDNRVLGYLRLQSAEPDIGHFKAE